MKAVVLNLASKHTVHHPISIRYKCSSCLCSVSFDPRTRHTIWGLVIGSTFNSLADYGFSQTLVQRYLCVRSVRAARQAILINIVGIIIFILLVGLIGLIIYAYYVNCDPYTAGLVSNPDQLFPYFVMDVLGSKKGLPGIFLACIFSGSLSTISSGLNSLAAVILEDFYKGLFQRQLSDERQGFLSKICSVVLGAVVIVLTLVVSYLGSVINAAVSLAGVLAGPIMGVFLLGFLFPQANKRGAFVGLLTSVVFQLWIFIGAQVTKNQRSSGQLPLSLENCTGVNLTISNITAITSMIK
jgi:SSS family transporter